MFRPLLLSSRPLLALAGPSRLARPPFQSLGRRAKSDPAGNDQWKTFFDEAPDSEEVQRGMNNVFAKDSAPPVDLIQSMLFAARRIDDFALAVRVLDVVALKVKQAKLDEYLKELKPVLEELGVPTRKEIYGTQHLGRYYHGPGEGMVMPPVS